MIRQKKKIMTAAVLTGAALGTTYAIMRHIAKKQYNHSIYADQPEEQNPMEGKRVVFVENDTDPVNADGKKGHLEAVANTKHIPTFYEKYIKRAIESAIMQQGDFIHEIIVSSDASTDGTQSVIDSLKELYPGQFKDLSGIENVGISANLKRCFAAATGKYIAILEGDDYWITPWKINRQVKFMRTHPKCSMCFSRIKLLNKDGKFALLPRQSGLPDILTGEDFIRDPNQNLIANFSCCLFDGDIARAFPDILYSERFTEIGCAFFIEQKGPIGFLPDIMSVYRLHESGVWSACDRQRQLESAIRVREVALQVCAPKYKDRIQAIIDGLKKKLKELGDV